MCSAGPAPSSPCSNGPIFPKEELKHRLSPLEYQVTQEKGTERAFTGKYYKLKEHGVYTCVVCGVELFSSQTKFDSGSGWPAFSDVISLNRIKLSTDLSHIGGNLLLLAKNPDMVRTAVACAHCGAHLGHKFSDGPKPTGLRYCVNSVALNFIKQNQDISENSLTESPDTSAIQKEGEK